MAGRRRCVMGFLAALTGCALSDGAWAADIQATYVPGQGLWSSPATWITHPDVDLAPNNGNGGFTYDVTMAAESSTLTLDIEATINSLDLVGGTITAASGSGNRLILEQGGHWSGGNLGAGLVVGPAANLSLDGPVTRQGHQIDNSGLMTFTSTSRLYFQNTGWMKNRAGGVVEFQQASILDASSSGSQVPYFYNFGTLRKVGAGTTATIVPYLRNDGVVDVQAGTLRWEGGGELGGTLQIAPGATLDLGRRLMYLERLPTRLTPIAN